MWAAITFRTTARALFALTTVAAARGRPAGHRLLQRGSQIDAEFCTPALNTQGKSLDEHEHIEACLREIDAREQTGLHNEPWYLYQLFATQRGQWASTDISFLQCQQFMSSLQECQGDRDQAKRQRDAQAGTATEYNFFDAGAEDFKCNSRIDWTNATNTFYLVMDELCYPAQCSTQDVYNLYKYELKLPGHSNAQGSASCDVLANFINSAAPYWIFGIGIFWVICNVGLARTPNFRALKCMLWCYMVVDISIGLALVIYGFFVLAQSGMPAYMQIILPGFGAIQIMIGVIISLAIDTDDKFKTGVCACLAGKSWLLLVSNVLSFGYGTTCLFVSIYFQFAGKETMEQVLDEYFKSKDGEELTFVDKQEVYDFMQTTQTAMVCLLLISAIVQFCTIALSAGCCCWEGGGFRKALKSELMFHKQEEEGVGLQRQERSEREASKWVQKHRAAARP